MDRTLNMIGTIAYHNGQYIPEDTNEEDFFGDADWTFKTKNLTFFYGQGFDGTEIAKVFLRDILVYNAGSDGRHSIETFAYQRGDTLSEYLKEENWEKRLEELYEQTLKKIDKGNCDCEKCIRWNNWISN